LLRMAEQAVAGYREEYTEALRQLRSSHLAVAPRLVHWKVKEHFVELSAVLEELAQAGHLSPAARDTVASFGERLSSVIITAALVLKGIPAVHLDAREVIVTDERHTEAAPLVIETYAKVRRAVARAGVSRIVVMGGFIGAAENGATTTLGRGGSDFTASLMGAALSADEIQIWTDVDGMLACDPRILPGGRCLDVISYEEAGQMAKFGAKVLHPATVLPAMRQRVPVVIRNSRNPEAPGTRIVETSSGPAGVVKSIACQGCQIALVGEDVLLDETLGSRVLNALQRNGIRMELRETCRSVFSFVVPDGRLHDAVVALYAEFFEAPTRLPDARPTKHPVRAILRSRFLLSGTRLSRFALR
ncbi:MAG: aspartate kinase, partial [Bryobacterales bacterium]|nr:aspartate kinase [Bryobacterales bacterium]